MSFDARVTGLSAYLALVRRRLSRDDAHFHTSKFNEARRTLVGKRTELKQFLDTLDRRQNDAIAHVYVERFGFLAPLQAWATARDGTTPALVQKDNAWTEYLHLTLLGVNDGLVLPVNFAAPVEVKLEGRPHAFPVCSAQRLEKELERANAILKVEHAFRFPEISDFVHASRSSMLKLERDEELDESFWVKFALVVLRHLVNRSLEHTLPIIIGEQALEPVAEAAPEGEDAARKPTRHAK